LEISELFYSLQGEGKRTGYPSFFIRTNFCNLRCKFSGGNLCYTAYASWFPEKEDNKEDISVSEIINEYSKFKNSDVVITGGEPALQSTELNNLCAELKSGYKNTSITLETNGTIYGKFTENIDLASISPKLKSSIPFDTKYEQFHSLKRINDESLRRFQSDSENGTYDIQWKFVITVEKDIEEILELQQLIGFRNKDIFLMPEGITKEQLNKKRKIVSELCKKHQMNYTDRLQIILWGNKRRT
jgi:7-carboxy-7-deazaguanine synthase